MCIDAQPPPYPPNYLQRFPSWEEFEGAYGTDINSSQLNKLHDVLKNVWRVRVRGMF
jgi:hypothetical protein